MNDQPPTYLVRLIRGRRRAQVFRLRECIPPKQWKFDQGVAVIDTSLSDALDRAWNLLGVQAA